MKDAYYFSHDSNARTDPKIIAMMGDYKSEGYGRFWIIIEMLSEQKDYKLKLNKLTFNAIAIATFSSPEDIEKFIYSCINDFELFNKEGEYFWSESLIRRMEMKNEKRRRKSEAGKRGANARWSKCEDEEVLDKSYQDIIAKDSSAMTNDSTAIASHSSAMQSDSKVKESIEKKRKIKEYVFMTETEYENLVEEYGKKRVDDKIEDLNNWKGGKGKTTKSDYLTLRSWLKKEEKEKSQLPVTKCNTYNTLEEVFGKAGRS